MYVGVTALQVTTKLEIALVDQDVSALLMQDHVGPFTCCQVPTISLGLNRDFRITFFVLFSFRFNTSHSTSVFISYDAFRELTAEYDYVRTWSIKLLFFDASYIWSHTRTHQHNLRLTI